MVDSTSRAGNLVASNQHLRPDNRENVSRVKADSLNQRDRALQKPAAAQKSEVSPDLEQSQQVSAGNPIRTLNGKEWDGRSPLPRGSLVDIII